MAHARGKNKTAEEKNQMANLIDKDFKTTLLKMVKNLKKDVENVKKITYEQNGNTNKEIENLKNNSRSENIVTEKKL